MNYELSKYLFKVSKESGFALSIRLIVKYSDFQNRQRNQCDWLLVQSAPGRFLKIEILSEVDKSAQIPVHRSGIPYLSGASKFRSNCSVAITRMILTSWAFKYEKIEPEYVQIPLTPTRPLSPSEPAVRSFSRCDSLYTITVHFLTVDLSVSRLSTRILSPSSSFLLLFLAV